MSVYTFQVDVYGTNTDLLENPLVADLVTAGATKVTINCNKLNIVPLTEGEKKEYDNKRILALNKVNFQGTLEYEPYINPIKDNFTNAVSFLNFFTIADVMKNRFIYLYSDDYQVELASQAENLKAVRINIDSMNSELLQGGFYKYLKINFTGGSYL